MPIKVQKFVIDEAVLDLIGNEFKFDHAKGLSEWLKNSADAYLREQIPDNEQYIYIRIESTSKEQIKKIECIDFVGMDKKQIDDAFKRFFDPEAAKKGSKQMQTKTFGGHGNGGKFYMRQMFKTSSAICFRQGKLNVFGFNTRKQYGFEDGCEDKLISLDEALSFASIENIEIPSGVRSKLEKGETGFTVVRGSELKKKQGTSSRGKLIDQLILNPQARRLIERKPISILFNDENSAKSTLCSNTGS